MAQTPEWREIIVEDSNADLKTLTVYNGIQLTAPVATGSATGSNVLYVTDAGDIQHKLQSSIISNDTLYTFTASNHDVDSSHVGAKISFNPDTLFVEGTNTSGESDISIVSDASNNIVISSSFGNSNQTYAADTGLGMSSATIPVMSMSNSQLDINQLGALSGGTITGSTFGTISTLDDISTSVNIAATSATFDSMSVNNTLANPVSFTGSFSINGTSLTDGNITTHLGSHQWGTATANLHEFTGSISVESPGTITAATINGDGTNLSNIDVTLNTLTPTPSDNSIVDFSYDGSAIVNIEVNLSSSGGLYSNGNGLAMSPLAITEDRLSDNAVDTSELLDGSVNAAKVNPQLISLRQNQANIGATDVIWVEDVSAAVGSRNAKIKMSDLALTMYDPANVGATLLTIPPVNTTNTTYNFYQSTALNILSIGAQELTTFDVDTVQVSAGFGLTLVDATIGIVDDIELISMNVTTLQTNGGTTTTDLGSLHTTDRFISIGQGNGSDIASGIVQGPTQVQLYNTNQSSGISMQSPAGNKLFARTSNNATGTKPTTFNQPGRTYIDTSTSKIFMWA